MKIGIYGGSFNPIHRGHMQLASALLDRKLVDELWLLVSPLNPLKDGVSNDIAAYEHRLHMAQLAADDVPHVRVSDFERHLPLPSYMVNTLSELSAAYPQHTLVLIIGADNWANFHSWHCYEKILNAYDIMIYRRPGCDIDETSLPRSVSMVEAELYDISSTQIRASIRDDAFLREWLDDKVLDYIKDHSLYGLQCP